MGCAGNAHIPAPASTATLPRDPKEECFNGTFRVLDTLEVEWPDDSSLVEWTGSSTADAYGQVLYIFVSSQRIYLGEGYTAWVNFENSAVLDLCDDPDYVEEVLGG